MAKPVQRPDYYKVLAASLPKIMAALQTEEVSKFVQRVNNEYLPWDEMIRKPLPGKLTKEELWAAVKLSRHGQYRTFPLADLQGNRFKYWLPDSAQALLHFITQKAAGTLGSSDRELPPWQDNEKYLVSSLIEEAISSSIIEGAVTTRAEAKKMIRENRRPRNESDRMILNNYRAIMKIRDLKDRPLSVEMLNEMHGIITRDILGAAEAGRLQQPGQARVKVVDVRDQEIVHQPPPAEELPERLEAICAFANETEAEQFVHPVVRAILLHFAIAYLHPYADGNGRTARAVFYWSMLRQGYWLAEYLSVSSIIRQGPVQYYEAFRHSEADERDATYFILYHLQVIERAIRAFDEYVKRQRRELQAASQLLRAYPRLNQRQRSLLAHALRHPDYLYTIASHASADRVTYHTSRTDLLDLEAKGFLVRFPGRPVRFAPATDLRKRIRPEE